MLNFIAQIILAAFITERLLEGLHRFYWTKKLKAYLIGDEDWIGDDGEFIKTTDKSIGILPDGALREFIRCKFCQSWWMAWFVSLMATVIWSGWFLHWVWMGLIVGLLSNMIHDVKDRLRYRSR